MQEGGGAACVVDAGIASVISDQVVAQLRGQLLGLALLKVETLLKAHERSLLSSVEELLLAFERRSVEVKSVRSSFTCLASPGKGSPQRRASWGGFVEKKPKKPNRRASWGGFLDQAACAMKDDALQPGHLQRFCHFVVPVRGESSPKSPRSPKSREGIRRVSRSPGHSPLKRHSHKGDSARESSPKSRSPGSKRQSHKGDCAREARSESKGKHRSPLVSRSPHGRHMSAPSTLADGSALEPANSRASGQPACKVEGVDGNESGSSSSAPGASCSSHALPTLLARREKVLGARLDENKVDVDRKVQIPGMTSPQVSDTEPHTTSSHKTFDHPCAQAVQVVRDQLVHTGTVSAARHVRRSAGAAEEVQMASARQDMSASPTPSASFGPTRTDRSSFAHQERSPFRVLSFSSEASISHSESSVSRQRGDHSGAFQRTSVQLSPTTSGVSAQQRSPFRHATNVSEGSTDGMANTRDPWARRLKEQQHQSRSPCVSTSRRSMRSRTTWSSCPFAVGTVDEVQNLRGATTSHLLNELATSSSLRSVKSPFSDVLPGPGALSEQGGGDFAEHTAELYVSSPGILRLFGVFPWTPKVDSAQSELEQVYATSRRRVDGEHAARTNAWLSRSVLYQSAVLLVTAVVTLAAAARVVLLQFVFVDYGRCGASVCLHFRHFTDLLLSLGSLLGLLALRGLYTHNLLGHPESILVCYARREAMLEAWSRASRIHGTATMLVWLFAVAARVWTAVSISTWSSEGLSWTSAARVLDALAFAFACGLFLALMYCLLHVSSVLTMMVDAFCFHFVEQPDLDCSVRNWNTLQALLRRTSEAIERGFLVLETTALAVVLVGMAAVVLDSGSLEGHGWQLLSASLLALWGARLFFKAAEVTEKCARVPALVNSLTFGMAVDPGRHYLVEYVTYSAAGFYVKEVRLTAAMALKLAYISGLAIFGVLTKLASGL